MAHQNVTPLSTILEAGEASESKPQESLPWPKRRRAFNGARRLTPAPGASPRLIEPIINSLPPSGSEFDNILNDGIVQGDIVLH